MSEVESSSNVVVQQSPPPSTTVQPATATDNDGATNNGKQKQQLKAPGSAVNKVTVHAGVNSYNTNYNYNPTSFHLPAAAAATTTSSFDLELNVAAAPFMTNPYHYMYQAQPFTGGANNTGGFYGHHQGSSGGTVGSGEYYWPMNPAMMPTPAALFPSTAATATGDFYHSKSAHHQQPTATSAPRGGRYSNGYNKPGSNAAMTGNRTNGYRQNQRSGDHYEGKSRREQGGHQREEKSGVAAVATAPAAVAPKPVLDDKNFPAIGGEEQPKPNQQQQQQVEPVVQREDSPNSHSSSSEGGNKKWADVVRKSNNPASLFDHELPTLSSSHSLPPVKTDQNNNELDGATSAPADTKNATSESNKQESLLPTTTTTTTTDSAAVGGPSTNGYSKSYHHAKSLGAHGHKNGHFKPNHYATMFNYGGEFYPSVQPQYSGIPHHHQTYLTGQANTTTSYLANDMAGMSLTGSNFYSTDSPFVSYLNGGDQIGADPSVTSSQSSWRPPSYRNKHMSNNTNRHHNPSSHHHQQHHHHQQQSHQMNGVPAVGGSWPNHTINQTCQDIYNPVDFKFTGETVTEGGAVNDASRFFIIKSYSREDVVRAIYNSVWCSTESGNARLSQAYSQKPSSVPGLDHTSVYLLFSVNGSGQFCGMAEMASPVDFGAKCPIWTQDKWKGKFDLKWIYVKDVPNGKFKHITLPNNENKPVTNSRDCQEIPIEQARQVLHVLRSYRHHSTILDDMWFNEQIMATQPSENGAASATSGSENHHRSSRESKEGGVESSSSSRYQGNGGSSYRNNRKNEDWDHQNKSSSSSRGNHSYKQLKLQNFFTAATAATLATSKSNGNKTSSSTTVTTPATPVDAASATETKG